MCGHAEHSQVVYGNAKSDRRPPAPWSGHNLHGFEEAARLVTRKVLTQIARGNVSESAFEFSERGTRLTTSDEVPNRPCARFSLGG